MRPSSRNRTLRVAALAFAALATFASAVPDVASAHGERNQEPFLRMRTFHWYDVTWSADSVAVNEPLVMEGKFRVFGDWPKHLFGLEASHFGAGVTGPVFAKVDSRVNDVSMMQSTVFEFGRDYEFRLLLHGRLPGRHHAHPLVNILDAGPLLGPGKFVEVTGDPDEFVISKTTLDGTEIPNLETWGLTNVRTVHAFWVTLAVFWIGWWLRKMPVFLPRLRAVQEGRADALVRPVDSAVAAGLVVVTLVAVGGGALWANAAYPRTSALQGGRVRVEPLPLQDRVVHVRSKRAVYEVPGRNLVLTLEVRNETDAPVRLGEFTAANLRFVDRGVPTAAASLVGYPEELVARADLVVVPPEPIAPGETRTIVVEAADAAWENERLAALMGNPDSSFGGLLFFFDDQGRRTITEVSGPALPVFSRDE